MSHAEFIGLINEVLHHLDIITLILVVTLYLFIYSRHLHSVFDPLFLATVYGALAGTDVIFLWLRRQIDVSFLCQFIVTEVAFFVGILFFKPLKGHGQMKADSGLQKRHLVLLSGGDRPLLGILYVISSVTFLVTQAITYGARGIPLFYDSRLEYYSIGGGIGTREIGYSMSRGSSVATS